jgi:hypothetical protein
LNAPTMYDSSMAAVQDLVAMDSAVLLPIAQRTAEGLSVADIALLRGNSSLVCCVCVCCGGVVRAVLTTTTVRGGAGPCPGGAVPRGCDSQSPIHAGGEPRRVPVATVRPAERSPAPRESC